MLSPPYDLILLGGGCAALSLANCLARLGPGCPRTLILEPRLAYLNDRSWCFWSGGPSPLDPLVRYRWPGVTLRAGDETVAVDCARTPYQMIPADAFYADALHTIAQCPAIRLQLGTAVVNPPAKVDDRWEVETEAGAFRGTYVIDTRPLPAPDNTSGSALWQSFAGCEIECEAAVFEPSRATLMDFASGNLRDIRFVYVLPMTAHRALIEATVFGPTPLMRGQLAPDLDQAVAARTAGRTFQVLRSEHGILPMRCANPPPHPDPTFVRAGVTAGAARPSTGYAFTRIQRWAGACAACLAVGGAPISHAADPWPLRAMDHLFLTVLRARPQLAPALFLGLFRKTDPARMIRFLSDRATLRDYAAIIAALPLVPFLCEIPHALSNLTHSRAAAVTP
ncbi:MAG: hypothetical protein K2X03_11890 [Bryobacteraceae bacterium]|nr:hypothetical protein [Bryobacteraceae bacterium]